MRSRWHSSFKSLTNWRQNVTLGDDEIKPLPIDNNYRDVMWNGDLCFAEKNIKRMWNWKQNDGELPIVCIAADVSRERPLTRRLLHCESAYLSSSRSDEALSL